MPRTIHVTKELVLVGDASHRRNVTGAMMEKMRHDYDRFTGITLDTTNRWATSVPGTGDSIAISEVQGGSVLITTGSVDDDSCMMSGAIIYSAAKRVICEWRITITTVAGVAVFVGLSDAKSQLNNAIAIHYAANVLTTVAANAVGWVIDADHATSSIMCEGVKANVDATSADTGTDWANGETKTLRVELDVDGNATFYLDYGLVGEKKAYVANAVTAATLLCPTVQAMTRANGGATTVRVHSFDAWQED